MATVLLLSGQAGCGKDAAASLLMEELGFRRFAFADPLKRDVAAKHGLPLDLFHTAAKDHPILTTGFKKPPTPRTLLLDHARVARSVDPDIYSRQIATAINEAIASDPVRNRRFVISDWRYSREYDFLTTALLGTASLICIRITRHGLIPLHDPSEYDLLAQPMHAMIDNNGSIEDLRDMLKSVLRIQKII